MTPTYRDPRELRAEAARLRATADAIEYGVWQFVCEASDRTPQKLAEHLGISEQAANNSLRKLHDLGLLDRERRLLTNGGRAYVYSVRVTA